MQAKQNLKSIISSFHSPQNRQSASALLYVLMLTASGSALMAFISTRAVQYKAQVPRLQANAFLLENLQTLNNQISCPGGKIMIKKDSCKAGGPITLSLNEIRRQAGSATPNRVAVLGTLPPNNRAYDYFDILHTRIVCYKQQSAFDKSGQPMQTDLKQQPCVDMKKINTTLTPYVGSGLLTGREERYLDDIATIENSIIPDITKKSADVSKTIAALRPPLAAAEQQLQSDLLKFQRAQPPRDAAYSTYVSAVNNYNYYLNLNEQAKSACLSSCVAGDPRLVQIETARSQLTAAENSLQVATSAFNTAQNAYEAAHTQWVASTKDRDTQRSALDTEVARLQSYADMKDYLQKDIVDGKKLILLNSQLAVVQAKGGVLANMLRYGQQGGAFKAASLLPDPSDSGLSSSQTTPESADEFIIGMLKIRPVCGVGKNGPPRLRFNAKVVDAPPSFPSVLLALEFASRREKLSDAMATMGLTVKDGWYRMPNAFTPEDCKLVEEDDPSTSGVDNFKADSFKNRTNK